MLENWYIERGLLDSGDDIFDYVLSSSFHVAFTFQARRNWKTK